MKRVAVFYATREGQTGKIAAFLQETLRDRGFDAHVYNVKNLRAVFDFSSYDAAILAASVHIGQHEKEMREFVKTYRQQLERIPNAFLSVSLSEAGVELDSVSESQRAKSKADVKRLIDVFLKETGWNPTFVLPVAGALLYTRYNFLVRFILKHISRASGGSTDTSRDHEYTDWAMLERFVDKLSQSLVQLSTPAAGSR